MQPARFIDLLYARAAEYPAIHCAKKKNSIRYRRRSWWLTLSSPTLPCQVPIKPLVHFTPQRCKNINMELNMISIKFVGRYLRQTN
jgi:hypothetical protein